MRRRAHHLWLVLLLASCLSAAPATGRVVVEDRANVRAIRLIFRPGQEPPPDEQLLQVVGGIAHGAYLERGGDRRQSWSIQLSVGRDGKQHGRVRGLGDRDFAIAVTESSPESSLILFRTGQPDTAALYDSTIAGLQAALKEVASIPAQQLSRQISDAEEELAHVHQMQQQIKDLSMGRAKVQNEIVAEKLKALELDKQRLEMDLAAKKARGQALRSLLRETVNTAATRPASADAVMEQLEKSLQAREQSLERMRKLQNQGTVSSAELAQAEESVLDAKARLAERKDQLAQPANPALISRLSEEVALVAVDQAELEARLGEVTRRLPPDNFSTLTEKDLARLSPDYFGLGIPEGKRPPLSEELSKRETALGRRLLALRLADVKPAEAPPASDEDDAFDSSRGRGFGGGR